jgi:hypothetical protein
LAFLSALVAGLLVFPGLRLAKCVLVASSKPGLSLMARVRFRSLSLLPFTYVLLSASFVYRADEYASDTKLWILIGVCILEWLLLLATFRPLVQSFLDLALLRQKQIAAQPKTTKSTIPVYANMILFIFHSSCVTALDLMIPAFVVMALGCWQASLVSAISLMPPRKLVSPADLLKFFPVTMVQHIVAYFTWWVQCVMMVVVSVGMTYGRAIGIETFNIE